MTIDKPLKSQDTRVPISRSQEEIRDLLARFGAKRVAFEEDFDKGTQVLRFLYPLEEGKDVPVQFNIETKGIHDYLRDKHKQAYKSDEYLFKQANRVAWRHILDWVKMNLNLVEFGLIPFENMFLSYFSHVLPDGTYKNLGDFVIPQLHSGEFFNKLLLQGRKERG